MSKHLTIVDTQAEVIEDPQEFIALPTGFEGNV